MNATVKAAISQHRHYWQWKGVLQHLSQKQRVCLLSLIAGVVISAFGLIYVTSLNRQLVVQQQELLAVQANLHSQWGQLLLEQGAYSNQATVANMAQQELGMKMPDANDIVMVR